MKLLRVLSILALLLAAHVAFAGERTFAELARNTKETDSIVLRGINPATPEVDVDGNPVEGIPNSRLGTASITAFEMAARLFDPSADAPIEVCEPKFLNALHTELGRQGVAADESQMRLALIELRQSNQIDDLVLLPLLSALPAWATVGYTEADWKSASANQPATACPTSSYLTLAGKVRAGKGRKFKRKHLDQEITRLAGEERTPGVKRYRDVEIAWFKALRAARFDVETPFALTNVLQQMARVKNTSPRATAEDRPTKIMSKRRKKAGGLSNRIILYKTYNAFQIAKLVERYEEYVASMDVVTAEAELVYRYKDGRPDKVIPLDAEEQRRTAAYTLHKEVTDLRNSTIMTGTQPTFDDVIIAAVEMGYIHAEELDQALGVDDLWNKQLTPWQRIWSVVRKYGTTALVLIPNPYTFWASLAITLVETSVGGKKDVQARDQGISIF